ncbi:TrfB-related DNA-binding protein [Pseudomonas sp.]|uniref:TrfB-related DNA-binding protein n=1 Tax=Pseudomonas sp. TaxID=306 RepID=UPI00290C68BB|nr:TrfB-related DNA-binding protein [Pseudomonas sp.]MDU4254565.1 TrfB-related DNA-binding protein [Pseudomonas sp.]
MAMTGEQFDALVKLMRGDTESAGNRAARRVLVDSITQAEAMRETDVTRAAVSNAVRRYTEADELIRRVYGVKKK